MCLYGDIFYKLFCKLQQRSQIFTKHLERQTITQLPAASENIYPTLIKGLYLYLDISMIIFFRSSYLQPKLSARLLVYSLYIVSVKLDTSFSYERKMGLLKKYVSKYYNKKNCRCFSKKHSRLNQDFFFLNTSCFNWQL